MSYEFKVKIRKHCKKFLKKLSLKDRKQVLSKIRDFRGWLLGENVNVDVKKLKGEWKGFYRIRTGKIRILLKVYPEDRLIIVYDADYRESVYK
ncbi:MAG TPA: hypothetical protein ENH28_02940 [Euryarchaeota archaeon]|nr:hypothetical protein BMS3Bbin15_00470 [archaeon BMS3Bbin15]HDL15101.1 hypothetical protein [Euryarchaeota archaeon]